MNTYSYPASSSALPNGHGAAAAAAPVAARRDAGPTERPEVNLRSLNGLEAVFQLSGVEMALANSVRRVVQAEVPTIAIDQVLFMQNTTPIPDEMLAHRLGLVPLISRGARNGLRFTRDCDCDEGCHFCMVQLRMKVICSGDTNMNVTSDMLEVIPSPRAPSTDGWSAPTDFSEEETMMLSARDPQLGHPVGKGDATSPPILLAKMSKGQEIELLCKAYKGIAKHHAKWSPLSTVGYEYDPYNKLKHTDYWYEVDERAEWPLSPNARFEQPPNLTAPFDYNAVPSTFYFNVEAVGSIPVRTIVEEGLDILSDGLATLVRAADVEIGVDDDEMDGDEGIIEPKLEPEAEAGNVGNAGNAGGWGAPQQAEPAGNAGGWGGAPPQAEPAGNAGGWGDQSSSAAPQNGFDGGWGGGGGGGGGGGTGGWGSGMSPLRR